MNKKIKNKKEHEILSHWWEYIVIIWWGFSPPSIDILLNGRKVETIKDINEKYGAKIKELYQTADKEKINHLENFINNRLKEEEERRKTIETKAQSLIGQTSIAISILLAAISFSITQYPSLLSFQKTIIWAFLFILLINFITVGLHARHAVILILGYSYENIDYLIEKDSSPIDINIEKYWMGNRNSYLNDYKATFLKCSHWFFKCSLVLALLMALIIPLLILSNNVPKDQKESLAPTIIYNTNNYKVEKYTDSLFIEKETNIKVSPKRK